MRMRKMLLLLVLVPMVIFAQDITLVGQVNHDPGDMTDPYYGDPGIRGLIAGSDLDQDGKQEIIASRYASGSGVSVFEMTDEGDLEMVWFSDTTSAEATAYSSGTRYAQTADFDNDGMGEIVFFRGRYNDDEKSGLYVYEYNGTDNGYDLAFFNNLSLLGGDTLASVLVEYFLVDDVDGDGTEEIIFASNGTSWGVNRSEDFFSVLSITQFGTPFATLNEEYYVSAREVANLGGGSAINLAVSDIDGDGNKEVYCHAWNNHNNFFFEATGPDSYTLGDTTFVKIALDAGDHVSLMNGVAADMDGDGHDEIYTSNYYAGDVYRIVDRDGEATTLTNAEIDTLALAIGAAFGATVGDLDMDGNDEIYFGGSSGSNGDLIRWDGTEFTSWNTDTLAGGFIAKMDVADINGNGYPEIVSAHQSVTDSIEVIDGTDTTLVVNPNYYIIRLSELSTESVKDYRVITPDQYKLGNAYPNPFNPITNINFSLPIRKDISLVIYNLRGQEVVRLIDNQNLNAGSHTAMWNGLDAQGRQVASGTYIYSLRYGNFQQSKQVTLIK